MWFKKVFLIIFLILFVNVVSASLGYSDDHLPKLEKEVTTAGGNITSITNNYNISGNYTTNNTYYVNISDYSDIALTNQSNSFTGNQTTDSWWNGLFNWTVLTNWLSFDGATLSFNESKLNATIGQYTFNLYNSSWDNNGLITQLRTDLGGTANVSQLTEYLLINGSRALTGNWDAGNFNITMGTKLTFGSAEFIEDENGDVHLW